MSFSERGLNLSHSMTRELGEAIVCGRYSANEILPTEAELSERFGVSRTAVREAVKMLSAKGLVTTKPRQGIRVLPQESWNIFDSDLLRWSLNSKPSMEVLREFLQMRYAIEPEAAALGARHASAEAIHDVHLALQCMAAAPAFSNEDLQSDIDFHIAILYASGNRFFIRMRDFVHTALNVSIRYTTLIKANHTAVYEEHAKVYEAIAARDDGAARRAMQSVIQEAIDFVELQCEETA